VIDFEALSLRNPALITIVQDLHCSGRAESVSYANCRCSTSVRQHARPPSQIARREHNDARDITKPRENASLEKITALRSDSDIYCCSLSLDGSTSEFGQETNAASSHTREVVATVSLGQIHRSSDLGWREVPKDGR
jgi:hypothetical protein